MSKPVAVTGTTFAEEVLGSDIPVLVDFWAPWCQPCRMMAPVLEKLAERNSGRLKVAKLNVDDHPELAGEYGIQGIPTLLLFQGGRPVAQHVGFAPEKELQEALDRLLVTQ